MGAEEEEHNRHAEQELLGRRVLISIVDLFPHVEIVVGARIEFERNTPHPVEHKEGAEHVADVGESPGSLLRDSRNDVEEDFECGDQHKMNRPGT